MFVRREPDDGSERTRADGGNGSDSDDAASPRRTSVDRLRGGFAGVVDFLFVVSEFALLLFALALILVPLSGVVVVLDGDLPVTGRQVLGAAVVVSLAGVLVLLFDYVARRPVRLQKRRYLGQIRVERRSIEEYGKLLCDGVEASADAAVAARGDDVGGCGAPRAATSTTDGGTTGAGDVTPGDDERGSAGSDRRSAGEDGGDILSTVAAVLGELVAGVPDVLVGRVAAGSAGTESTTRKSTTAPRSVADTDVHVPYLCSQLDVALDRLDQAEGAVVRGDYAAFLDLYYAANRQQVLLYQFLDTGTTDRRTFDLGAVLDVTVDGVPGLHVERRADFDAHGAIPPGETHAYNLARRIRSVAAGTLPPAERALVDDYLTEGGSVKPRPAARELYNAVRVLHEWNVGQFRQRMYVNRFLKHANRFLTLVLVGFVAALALAVTQGLGTALLPEGVDVSPVYLLLVPAAGAIGALFSSLFPVTERFYDETTDPEIPAPETMEQVMRARLLVGAISGVLLYLLATSGIVDPVINPELLADPAALLFVAFLGGFSERVLARSIERVEERAAEARRGAVAGPPAERDGK